MNELELKYGCNPNQKPARIFMKDGADLPIHGSQRQARLHQPARRLQLAGSSCKELKEATGLPAAASLQARLPRRRGASACRSTRWTKGSTFVEPERDALPHRLRLHPRPRRGPPVLLRRLGGALRRVRRRHRRAI